MKERLCKLVGVEEIDVQLVDYYNDKFYASLESELDKTLDDARIMDGQSIMLAEKVRGGVGCLKAASLQGWQTGRTCYVIIWWSRCLSCHTAAVQSLASMSAEAVVEEHTHQQKPGIVCFGQGGPWWARQHLHTPLKGYSRAG